MSEIPRTQNRSVIEFDALFEPLLDSDEAAQLLRMYPKTLQRLARRGKVPVFKSSSFGAFEDRN